MVTFQRDLPKIYIASTKNMILNYYIESVIIAYMNTEFDSYTKVLFIKNFSVLHHL